MTALDQFARLECTGLWRENENAQRLEVIVSLGEATIVINHKLGGALAHWSLPAVDHRFVIQLQFFFGIGAGFKNSD